MGAQAPIGLAVDPVGPVDPVKNGKISGFIFMYPTGKRVTGPTIRRKHLIGLKLIDIINQGTEF